MSHTNSTTNYSLPQFITTDKPAWMTDINGAFQSIDTGMNAAKTAADNAQSDATQALTDAGNAQTKANTADSKAGGAIASISEDFVDSATYVVGDLVMYNNLLYVCHTAVTVPGAWTGSTNWTRVDIDSLLSDMKATIPHSLTDLSDVTITTPLEAEQFVVVDPTGQYFMNRKIIEKKYVNTTTDANGFIDTGLSADDFTFLSLDSSLSHFALPLNATSTGTICIQMRNSSFTPIANGAFEFYYWVLHTS